MRTVALVYVRKSRVKKGQTDPASPEMQEREGRRVAEARGWFAEVFSDAKKGHNSGKTDQRAALQRLLTRAKDADVAAVIVYRYSRLARNAKMLLTLLDEWAAAGVQLVSVADSIDVSTPQGRLFFTVAASFDEFNSNDAGQWRADNIDFLRRQKGRHYGLAPFGTRRVPQNGDLVLVPSDLAQPNGTDHDALRSAYELYVTQRMGMRYVVEKLNADGWRYRDRNGLLRPWTFDDLRRALASHWVYAGYVTVGRAHRDAIEILPGSHQPILPDTLLAPVALRLEQSHKPGARVRKPFIYPLSAILKCACGAPLKGIYTDGARRYRHMLTCRAGHRYQHRADDIELAVREHIAALPIPAGVSSVSDAETLRHLAAQQGGGQGAERERLGLAVDRLAELYADGMLTRAQYDAKRAVYEAQMPAASVVVAAAPGPAAGLPPIAAVVGGASPGMLREIAAALYDAIVVEPDGTLTYQPRVWCPWAA